MEEGYRHRGIAGALVELQKTVVGEERALQNLVEAEVGDLRNVV